MQYRVVQWATGNIGLRSLRQIIRHTSMELAGVLTYDPAKDGVDAGVLCGETPTGIKVTRDRAAIHALRADCVLYMPRVLDIEDLVTFAEAGTNIVSTCVELYDGASGLSEADRARLTAACLRTGASVYATGSSPGFITDALPFALLSLQRRVDSIEIDEFANLSQRDSPHMLFEQMGYGKPLAAFGGGAPIVQPLPVAPPAGVIARAAGLSIDKWTSTTEVAATKQKTKILAGEIAAGTVGCLRITYTGQSGGKDVIRFRHNWYCTKDLDPAWDLLDTGWRAKVRGDASLDVQITFPVRLEDFAEYTPALTANPPVNAVPYVCAARPGILRTVDLPPMTTAGPAVSESVAAG